MSNETNENSGWDFTEKKTEKPKKTFTKTDYNIFLKLVPQEKPFRVRLCSKPKNFRSHWNAFKSLSKAPIRSPAYSLDEIGLDIAWQEGDWLPQKRHACLVFDRDDGNKMKILEAPDTLFVAFGNWYQATKVNPAGKDATDWFIWVKKEGAGGGTSYSATPDIKVTAFTPEEQNLIDTKFLDLDKIIKIKTPEEIMSMWLSLPDDKKYNPKSKYRANKVFDPKAFPQLKKTVEPSPVVAKTTEQPKAVEKTVEPLPVVTKTAEKVVEPVENEEDAPSQDEEELPF